MNSNILRVLSGGTIFKIVPLLATESNSISLASGINFVTTTGLSAATSSAKATKSTN